MLCGCIWLAMLQFYTNTAEGYLNGDNHIQNFHFGGILSDILLEIAFYDSAGTSQ